MINIKAIHNRIKQETQGRITRGFSIPKAEYIKFVENTKAIGVSRSKYLNAFMEDFMKKPSKITLNMLEDVYKSRIDLESHGFALRDVFDKFSLYINSRRSNMTDEEKQLYNASTIMSYYIMFFNRWIEEGGLNEQA